MASDPTSSPSSSSRRGISNRRNQLQDDDTLARREMGTNNKNNNKYDRLQQPRNEDDSICSEQTQTVPQQFMEHDGCRLLLHSLSFLDVLTLLRKQVVSKQFKELCSQTITAKCGNDGPPPLTNETLRTAVREFCPIMYDPDSNKEDMETIACTYGYPIDSWNVSQVTDMSNLLGLRRRELGTILFLQYEVAALFQCIHWILGHIQCDEYEINV
ncbi:hypothetical protein IV203_002380 [Nitzschia inconspicua]|uniref:Uncharacterized protein n=1 Tax=Nitzschia inconspicua TaxID=303405 RepID=A0A9K3L8Z1_9STRA|nr:hypothetical protein IV203_002380 [Nitzschia inconspicua]